MDTLWSHVIKQMSDWGEELEFGFYDLTSHEVHFVFISWTANFQIRKIDEVCIWTRVASF